MSDPIFQQRTATVPDDGGLDHLFLVYSRPEKGEILAKEHGGLRPAAGLGLFRHSLHDKRRKWFVIIENPDGTIEQMEIDAKYINLTKEDEEENSERAAKAGKGGKNTVKVEPALPLTIESTDRESSGYTSDGSTKTVKAYGKGGIWNEEGSITPIPSPTLSAITDTDLDFQEDLERTERTVQMVKEQERKKKAEEQEVEDIEMRNGWLEDISEDKWQQLTEETARKAEDAGMTGMESEIRIALEEEVRKAKRKRTLGDVDEGRHADKGNEAPKRIIANTKRAIIEKVVTGLMASKHASIGKLDKGKGREARKLTPEKGESAGKPQTLEERVTAMERSMGTMRWEIRELTREVTYWKRMSEQGRRSEGPKDNRQEGREPHRDSDNERTTPRSDQPAHSAPNQWVKIDRENETRRIARERDTRRKIQKEKDDEKKNQGAIVIDMGDKPVAGKSLSQEELISKAVEAGMGADEVQAVSTTINGNLRVTIKKPETTKQVVTRLENRNQKVRSLERWAGIVVGRWSKQEWEGQLGKLGEILEKAWGVKLMKEPRWLANDKATGPGKDRQPIVAHVAKASEREAILNGKWFHFKDEEGYQVSKKQQGYSVWMREFVQNGGTSKPRICTKCTQDGHMWWECRNLKKCGHCGKGHTSWEHAVRGITGDTNPKPNRK